MSELSREELLEELNRKLFDVEVVVGLTKQGIYTFQFSNTEYLSINECIYKPFNTEIEDTQLYGDISRHLDTIGYKRVKVFLDNARIFKEELIERYILYLNYFKKIEMLHPDVVLDTEFNYGGKDYMLELTNCRKVNIKEQNFLYDIVYMGKIWKIQEICDKVHLKNLDILDTEELEFLSNFIYTYKNMKLNKLLNVDNFIEEIGKTYNL